MSVPRVSVVVTAYQYGRFLGRAIESVLGQDYPADAIELIVVDDGSTDDTPQVVEPYLGRLTYVRQENAGVVAATNRGLDLVTGDLVTLLCADDTWPLDRVRRLVELLERRPEVGVAFGDMVMIDEHDAVVAASYHEHYRVPLRRGRLFGSMIESSIVAGGACMFRASFLDVVHPIAEWAPFEDSWIVTLLSRVTEFDHVEGPVLHYRLHGANSCLEVGGEQLARQLFRETRFRRFLLADIRTGEVTRDELVAAWRKLEWAAGWSAAQLGRSVEEAIPVDDLDRARSAAEAQAAERLLARGRSEAAQFALVRALAHDPWSGAARARLEPLLAAPVPAGDLATRSVAVLAFADELLAEPSLLDAFAAEFGPSDDATLVIHPGSLDPATVADALGPLVEGVSADLLAVTADVDPAQLAARVERVLSSRQPGAGIVARRP